MGKKQHFVPQCYLNIFTVKGTNQVYVFDKKNHNSRVSNITDVAEMNYFYELPSSYLLTELGLDHRQAIEEFFSQKVETEFSKLLNTIIDGVNKNINPLTNGCTKLVFSKLLALQYIRVNAIRNDLMDSSNCLQQVLNDMGFVGKAEELKLGKEKARDIHNRMIFDDEYIEEITKIFFDLTWIILVNKSGQKFYTSDNPITTIGHADMGLLSNNGLLCPGIEVAFPISPSLMLLMIDGEYHNLADDEGNIFVTEEKQTVRYYNCHQVYNAERSIISSDKDFWLIHDIFLKNPNAIDSSRSVLTYGGKQYTPKR